MEFAEFVMNIFRISKYECYLIFKHLVPGEKTMTTSITDFKELIMTKMNAIDSKIG
jgi:hypothetical protein